MTGERSDHMHEFTLATEVLFGPQAIDALSDMPYRSIFIITDEFLVKSGMLAKLARHLPVGAAFQTYSHVRPDPSQELVDEGACAFAEANPDIVIAFGGGSCIDAAKAMLRQAMGRGVIKPYFLAIPTTAGTGSEVTNFAVITCGDRKVVHIDASMAPDAALLVADFTRSVPARITVDTGMDVLTHAIEAYVSTGATSFSDALAVKAIRMVLADLPQVYRDGMAMRARSGMIEASCMAGAAFTNAGLGINHSLAHALGGTFHVAHGRLNAVLLPYTMAFHMAERASREPFERLALELGMEGADALLRAILDLRIRLGIESCLSELDQIDALAFDRCVGEMAQTALHDRCTCSNVRAVSKQDLVNLYRDAMQGVLR